MAPLVGIAELKRVFDAGSRDAFHDVGYALMTQLVEKQLRSGQSALLDCVARSRLLEAVREEGDAHGARLRVVECICSDEALHRSRVEGQCAASRAGTSSIGTTSAGRELPTSHCPVTSS